MKEKSYAKFAAECVAEEYAWIKTDRDQELSDELDRVMKTERDWGTNPHWRNMYMDHGRETACLELMYERSTIEFEWKRRDREEAEQRLRHAMEADWHQFINERFFRFQRPINQWNVIGLNTFDAKFIEDQAAKGHPVESLKFKIAEIQEREAQEHQWRLEVKRREQQAEADRQRKKIEGEQRQAATFAKAVRAEAQTLIKDLIKAGVLHVTSK